VGACAIMVIGSCSSVWALRRCRMCGGTPLAALLAKLRYKWC
jgi:hypothetical protein